MDRHEIDALARQHLRFQTESPEDSGVHDLVDALLAFTDTGSEQMSRALTALETAIRTMEWALQALTVLHGHEPLARVLVSVSPEGVWTLVPGLQRALADVVRDAVRDAIED